MSPIYKAAWHSTIGVAWRLFAFLLIMIFFSELSSLKAWHSSYAPSHSWANVIAERKDLEWSQVVSQAVITMPQPARPYTDKEIFYKYTFKHIKRLGQPEVREALFRHIEKAGESELNSLPKNSKDRGTPEFRAFVSHLKRLGAADLQAIKEDNDSDERIKGYYESSQEKKDIEESLLSLSAQSAPLEVEFAAQSKELKRLAGEIAKAQDEQKLKKLIEQRTSARENIRGLSAERGMVEAGLQRQLTDVNARIKRSEEGIREVLGATVSSARPVNGRTASLIGPDLAIQIGDETHPLHIFYIVLWYGLEAFIAFLACLVVVPCLISLGSLVGGTPDPKSFKGDTTTWIKSRLSDVFGPRGIAIAAKAGTAAAVTGLTLAGVTLAAGEQPPIAPILHHESEGAAGTRGEKGDPGHPGDPANSQAGGTNDGKTGPSSDLLASKLEDQTKQIQAQANVIADLKAAIEKLPHEQFKLDPNQMDSLATKEDLAGGVRTLNQGMLKVDERVGGLGLGVGELTRMNQSMMSSSEQADRIFMESLDLIHGTAWTASSGIQQVKADIDKAKDVPPITVDLLQMNSISDGALVRINPFNHYRVTDEVIEVVKRAAKYYHDSEMQPILSALAAVHGKSMSAGKLRLSILTGNKRVKENPASYRLLDKKLMRLILKVSRT
jgi:hypothetical protein